MSNFDCIIGYGKIKKELLKICDSIKNKEKYEKLGIKPSKGVLIFGEPGLGKTLMCDSFIKECNLPTFTCRKTKADGNFVDMIVDTFNKAKEKAPSIVFLDDVDKFANEDEQHRDAEEYVVIQSCIDEAKNCDVFVLATANDIDKLPPSLRRAGRFDRKICVEEPTGQDAIDIVAHYLKQKKNVCDVDVNVIGRILEGYSCAQLETIINEAGLTSCYKNKDNIDMDDLMNACCDVVFDASFDITAPYEECLAIATHEAGHIITRQILAPGTITIASIYQKDGNVGGVVTLDRKSCNYKTADDMYNKCVCTLAGRAATELFYGTQDIGCRRDNFSAADIAGSLIKDLCVNGLSLIDAQRMLDGCVGDATRDNINNATTQLMTECLHKAQRLIVNNKECVKEIAEALATRKYLIPSDIDAICAKYQLVY